MEDPEEHELVVKALTDNLGGCVNWKSDRTQHSARAALDGRTPTEIKRRLIEHVRRQGGSAVVQVKEAREGYRDRFNYYYKVVFPDEQFRDGIFVEIVIVDSDPEVPVVHLVSAHPQVRSRP